MDRPSGENVGDVPSVPRMTFESKSDIERIYSRPLATYTKCEPSGEIPTSPKPEPEKVCPSGSTNVDRATGNSVERRDSHIPLPVSAVATRAVSAMGRARLHSEIRGAIAVGCNESIGSFMRNRAVDMSAN